MEREIGKFSAVSANGIEVSRLQEMDKREIIKQYLTLKSALDKAESEIDVYRQLLTERYEQSKSDKLKTPAIERIEYDSNWSWINKIVFVLKKLNRPLLSSDMIAFLTPYEQILQYSRHPAQAFSAHLTKAVKYDRVKPYKLRGARDYYYILSAWLSQDG